MEVTIGKLEGATCYFTGVGPGLAPSNPRPRQNGTADGEFQVATLNPGSGYAIDWAAAPPASALAPVFGPGAVVAGFREDGAQLGICLMPGGEAAGSKIPGKLFLTGDRAGQCSWSSSYTEHVATAGYSVATAFKAAPCSTFDSKASCPPRCTWAGGSCGVPPPPTPAPPRPRPPPVPAEPIPALLEPHGKIYSARLSYGPRGAPEIMGLTFGTPNTTSSSYAPVVLWGLSASALTSSASCVSSAANRSCYTLSPRLHYCNMTGLQPGTKYFYQFGDKAVGLTPATYSFTSAPALATPNPRRSSCTATWASITPRPPGRGLRRWRRRMSSTG